MRDSMVFYRSFYEAVKDLPPDDFKKAVCALMDYGLDEIVPESTGIEKTIYVMAKPQIDKNNQRYINGKSGGRPTKKSPEEMKESREARNSQEYIKWRDAVYKRDEYTCALCGADTDLHAHHKKGFDEFPSLRYVVNNGITLCRKCHLKVHKKPSDNRVITECEPNVNDNVNDNVNVNVKKLSAPADFDKSPCAGKFLLNDGSEYIITENDVETYQQLYPAIDVRQEIRSIEAWCLSNPKNRKTRNGAKRFLNGWLSRTQNSAPVKKMASANKTESVKKNAFNNFDQRSYDFDKLENQLLNSDPVN